MTNDDKLYIKSVKNKIPNLEVFAAMTQILADSQKEVARLSSLAYNIDELSISAS